MSHDTPKTFAGYTILREAFVRGGSGVVHEAVDPRGRRVAIKVLDRAALEQKLSAAFSETARDPKTVSEKVGIAYERNVERFKEEYRALTSLNHPNIAKVYELGFADNCFHIVYEYVDGKPIAEFVRGWEPEKMIKLFAEALQGLDCIHRNGLLHLDIKSENILVRTADGKPEVKIIDFGLAMTPTEYKGGFFGSVDYMAPEIALGLANQVDARADLFSFGVLMYYCITWGSHPFARPPKAGRELMRRVIERDSKIPHDPPSFAHLSRPGLVPEFLDTIVMRLIAHDPKDRFYGNARAVMNALVTHTPDAFSETPGVRASYLIPEGDRHIENADAQAKVFTAINALATGEIPSPAIVEITGDTGTGKSHLLKKIREHAEKYADKLAIKKIELPADDAMVKSFADDITLWASENKQPAVVLIDSDCHCERAAGERGNLVEPIIKNLLNSISERETNPKLYSGLKPLMFVFTQVCHSEASCLPAGRQPKNLVVSLHPFTPAELKEYLASTPAFKGRDVPDGKVAELHTITDGIQAEVIARLREFDSDGMLFSLTGEIVMSDLKHHHEKAPATTEARLVKTYESLSPDERRILDFLSVWGLKGITSPPDFETISHLVPSPFTAVCVNNLVQTSIIDKSPLPRGERVRERVTYSFTNPYFSILIYNRMAGTEKIRWHDAIAKHISSFPTIPSPLRGEGQGEGDLKAAILLHRGLGSDKSLAVKSLVKLAKNQLYEKGRADFAAWLVENAMTFVEPENPKLKVYLGCLLAEALFYKGELDTVEKILDESLAALSKICTLKQHLETYIQIWRALNFSQQKRYDEAAATAEERLHTYAKTGATAFYPKLLNLKAWNFYRQSFDNSMEAISLLEKSAAIYRESGLYEKKLPLLKEKLINSNNLGVVLRMLGKLPEAALELEKNLAERRHTIFSRLVSTFALAETCRMLGEYKKAENHGREALKTASSAGLGEWLIHAHRTLAGICHDMDRFDEAIEEDRKCLASSGYIEDGRRHGQTLIDSWIHMGHCHKEKGDKETAISYFEAAIVANAKGQNLMSAHLGMGEIFFNAGEKEKALDHLSRAKKILNDLPKNAITNSHENRIKAIMGKLNQT